MTSVGLGFLAGVAWSLSGGVPLILGAALGLVVVLLGLSIHAWIGSRKRG